MSDRGDWIEHVHKPAVAQLRSSIATLTARAETAEAALSQALEALRPFARDGEKCSHLAEEGQVNVCAGHLHRAASVVSQISGGKGG